MLSANALSNRLQQLLGGGVSPEAMVTNAVNRAHDRTLRRYTQSNPAHFDSVFLHSKGKPIVAAFLGGKLTRHMASEAMAQVWNAEMAPIPACERKQRLADTAMMADVFFMELTIALDR